MFKSAISFLIFIAFGWAMLASASADEPMRVNDMPAELLGPVVPVIDEEPQQPKQTQQTNPFPVQSEYFVKNQLTYLRGYSIPKNTLQMAVFYDGSNHAELEFEVVPSYSQGSSKWIKIEGIPAYDNIATFQFDFRGEYVPTGCLRINKMTPNGVIDGVALGMIFRDHKGEFSLIKSRNPNSGQLTFVGMWPAGMNDKTLSQRLRKAKSHSAIAQVKVMLFGSEYMGIGDHCLPVT